MTRSWQEVVAQKRQERQERIGRHLQLHPLPKCENVLNVQQLNILSQDELNITEKYDATALLQLISTRKLKSEDVTRAFCRRAGIAQHLTNCLTEVFFDDAIDRARQLDAYFNEQGRPVGPLHGLPISLKDSFNVKDYDSSLGVVALCFKPATSNSALVDQLLSLGAVLYCKTNVPQTLSALDSHNNVFGRTLNPLNAALTAGGSSGGEGALMAMKGSVLGIGTDVGGSIRIPAYCNNVIGFKPSHGRVPYAGQQSGSHPGGSKIAMEPTAGPLTRSVRDCELFLRVIADAQPHLRDPDVFLQTWQQQDSLADRAPLRIGVIRSDGHTQPLPPVRQVIDEVVSNLRSSSFSSRPPEIVELDVANLLPRCVKVFNGLSSIDGAHAWFDLLESSGEPLSPWLQGRLQRRAPKDSQGVAELQAQRTALRAECLKMWMESGGYWKETGTKQSHRMLDIVICPIAPHPVALVDHWNGVNYTAMFNLLDYPAATLPIRTVTKQDIQKQLTTTKPINGWDKVNLEMWTKVDRSVYLGSPLSIQVVARRLEERRLVESMAVIQAVLKNASNRHGAKSLL